MSYVIIETVLPIGMVIPYNFGIILQLLAPDGDPVDLDKKF
jgi:inorganic pyrophosphatase